MRKKIPFIILFFSIIIIGCNRKTIPGNGKFYSEVGYASYYSDKFNGKPTSNGEIFKQKKLTAAHKQIAFGTLVKVTNLSNNKSVIVKINDRGPFIKGRIIDLSKSAAQKIDLLNAGIAKVKIEYRKE